MSISEILQKFPEVRGLKNENVQLRVQCAELEEQNKQSEEEIIQLKKTLSLIQMPEEAITLLNELREAKEKYEEEYKKITQTDLQEIRQTENPNETIEEKEPYNGVEDNSICDKIELLNGDVKGMKLLLNDFLYKDNINKELHEELQNYKNGFRKEITNPILKNIIHWYDKVIDLYDFYEKEENCNLDKQALFSTLLQEYKNLSVGLLDLLYDYDIEPLNVKEGDEYSPKLHKVTTAVLTEDDAKVKKIAECKKVGFQDVIMGRLIRPAEVIIYKK